MKIIKCFNTKVSKINIPIKKLDIIARRRPIKNEVNILDVEVVQEIYLRDSITGIGRFPLMN